MGDVIDFRGRGEDEDDEVSLVCCEICDNATWVIYECAGKSFIKCAVCETMFDENGEIVSDEEE